MAMHLEFVILGPPISNQQSNAQGKSNLTAWRATVAGEAQNKWAGPLLSGHLKAVIINFHSGNKPSVDVDNMSKPILDVLQNIVYGDDRQIRQAEITHLEIGAPFSIVGVSKIIVNALQAGNQFVYVRVEDPVNPYPLPM
jgi:Holliday junction resolvase RusA-like endonuclease